MTKPQDDGVQSPFAAAIKAAADAPRISLAELTKSERMKHHRKRLDGIVFSQGILQYRKEHPEAAGIKIMSNPRAYLLKPAGYNDRLAHIVEHWFTLDVAINATNKADVERLNEHLGTTYSPATHFNQELTKVRLKRLANVFEKHGGKLDVEKTDTMSKVRQAVKVFRASKNVGKPFGSFGIISGNTLVIGGHSFNIESNSGRKCVRLPHGLKRRRMYLDELEWLLGLIDKGDTIPAPSTTVRSIRELAFSGETGETALSSDPEISELAYSGASLQNNEGDAPTSGVNWTNSDTEYDHEEPLNNTPEQEAAEAQRRLTVVSQSA